MKKKRSIGFVIGFVLFTLIYFLLIEIYKITIGGWIVAAGILICYFLLHQFKLRDKKWYLKFLSWICLAALLLANAKLFWPPTIQIPAVANKEPEVTDVISVQQGQLTGVYNEDKSVAVYAGIPYAKPPIGDLRWKEPQPADKWDGVKACDTFAPMSMQSPNSPIYSVGSQIVGYHNYKFTFEDNYNEAASEDSLYLNVWTPAGVKPGDNLPVIVYYHGGSLTTGQPYYQDYNGETFAENGVIFITVGYRLGVFGYLATEELTEESPNHTTGNYGLLDQIEALKWVNANVASFGGDVSNITIAGESAGSSSVNALCVSPLAKGLFKNVIAESSGITPKVPYHTFRTYDKAISTGKEVMEEMGCDNMAQMREVPAEKLLQTKTNNGSMTVDGYAITEQPYLTYEKGENNEQALLNGYNADEAYVFMMFNNKSTADTYVEDLKEMVGDYNEELAAMYPASDDDQAKANLYELYGVAWFDYSHHTWSDYMAAENRDVYLYYFNKDNGGLGVWHSGEVPYAYGNLDLSSGNYDDVDEYVSDTMVAYWTNFAKTGNPNASGLPKWERYNDDPTQILEFADDIKMIDNKYTKTFEVFDKYMDSLVK